MALVLAGCSSPSGVLTRASENDSAIDTPVVLTGELPVTGDAGSPDVIVPPTSEPPAAPAASPEAPIEASPETQTATNATPLTLDPANASEPPAPSENVTASPGANETSPPANATLPPPALPTLDATASTPPATPAPAPQPLAIDHVAVTSESVEAGREGVLLTGQVHTDDAERITRILIVISAPGNESVASHDITAEERGRPSPGPDEDGFQVWRTDAGTLAFSWRFAPERGAPTGDASLVAKAYDALGATAESEATVVTIDPYDAVIASTTPIASDGQTATGEAWGSWTARAGSKNVASRNYIKVVNAGDNPVARVILDFGTDGFRGTVDPRFVIDTVDNLEFSWWEARGSAMNATPRDGSYTWHAASDRTGDIMTFTRTDSAIFVTYRIKAMPNVLPVQPYGSSYTLTEV